MIPRSVAVVERASEHPLARAVAAKALDENVEVPDFDAPAGKPLGWSSPAALSGAQVCIL